MINHEAVLNSLVKDVRACGGCVDVGFVVDVSGSVGSNYPQVQTFLKDLAGRIGLSTNGVHVSVVQFASNATLEIPFLDDIATFISRVDALKGTKYQTRIDIGLDVALDEMFQSANGMRPYDECSKVAIIMADGKNTEPWEPMNYAKKLRDARIRVVVVGIGNSVNQDELRPLVEVDDDFHLAQDFDDLISDSFLESTAICQDKGKP